MLPIKLKIENFFSHKSSEVDFSLFNSALLVGNIDGDYLRSNGSGKSAIMESILWCLYNKSRATTMDDVITWGENRCSVSFHFSHGEREYLVRRIRMRNTSTSTVELMYIDDEGKWMSLSGSTSGETNDRIINLLKIDYKTFVNSAYFRQNDISEFATSEASKRKEILKSIVDISKWDLYEKEAKKKVKEYQTEIIKYQATYETLKQEVDLLLLSKDEFSKVSILLEEKTKEKQKLQESLDITNEKYLKYKNSIDTASWDKAAAEILQLKQLGKETKTKYESVMTLLNKKLEKKDSLSGSILSLEKKVKTLSFDPDVELKSTKIWNEITEYSASSQQAKLKLKELSDIHFHEGECYTCRQSIDHDVYVKIKEEHENNIAHYSQKKKNADNRLQHLKILKEELDTQKEANKIIEKSKDDIKNLQSQLEILVDDISISENEKEELYQKLIKIKEKIVENERVLESLKDESFQTLHNQLRDSKAELEKLSEDILSTGIRVGSLKEKIESLTNKNEELDKIKKKLDSATESMSVFDKMTKIFGKGGIQTLLLDAVISDLEKSANKILSSICSDQFTISLETQRLGSDGVSMVETLDLNVKKDGSLCGFSSLSGGEQFRIALSLRIALSELATRHGGSSLEFLLLDEINSPLDKSGVENLFVNIIKALESKYKILVITHDESLKERFENVIDVSKINGESSVSYYNANILI